MFIALPGSHFTKVIIQLQTSTSHTLVERLLVSSTYTANVPLNKLDFDRILADLLLNTNLYTCIHCLNLSCTNPTEIN